MQLERIIVTSNRKDFVVYLSVHLALFFQSLDFHHLYKISSSKFIELIEENLVVNGKCHVMNALQLCVQDLSKQHKLLDIFNCFDN